MALAYLEGERATFVPESISFPASLYLLGVSYAGSSSYQAAEMAEAAVDHAGGCRPPGEKEVGIAGWSWDTAQEGSKKPVSRVRENRRKSRVFSPNFPYQNKQTKQNPELQTQPITQVRTRI